MPSAALTLKPQDWATLRLQLIWVYRGVPRMRIAGPDNEQSTQLYLLHAGSVTVTTDLARVTARSGDWMITTSKKREHRFSDDAHMTSINLRAHWADDRPLFPDDPPLRIRSSAYPRLQSAAERLLKLIGGFPDRTGTAPPLPASNSVTLAGYLRLRQTTHALLLAYASAMLSAGRTQNRALESDSRVTEAQRLLDTHPLTSFIDHHRLAAGLGLSESHLSRLFVEQFGITPRQYELRRRLQRARDMVSESNLPIKQIAYLLGFRQPSHFTGFFRKHIGRSPRRFRAHPPHYDVAGPPLTNPTITRATPGAE